MDVPGEDVDLRLLWDFANTFNADERVGNTVDAIAAHVERGWRSAHLMPDDLVAARCALFVARRRAHDDGAVTVDGERFVRCLVGHIRQLSGGMVFRPPDDLA